MTKLAAASLTVTKTSSLALIILGIGILLNFALFFGYFIFFEAVWRGQTPGKRLLGLRVTRIGGTRIGAGEAAIRNLLRVADGLPIFYGVGMLSIAVSRRRQRLGDFAAGTIVVREGVGAETVQALPRLQQAQWTVPPAFLEKVPLLDDELGNAIDLYQARRGTLFPERRTLLAARLAALVTARVDDLPAVTPEALLENLWLARHLSKERNKSA
jgi:uncharacterized RDD family membrane protein YckC